MGLLKRVFGGKEVVIDPADLVIPDEVQTDKPGLTLKKSSIGQPVEIEIVGESFRARNIEAIANAAQGREFNIYLVPEPTNQYDKKAVAVYAATLHIGYVAKPGNRQWFKWANEALERKELLWGMGRVISRPGTANSGVFGSIYMPKIGRDVEELIPQKMTETQIRKAVEKIISLSNSAIEPETTTQLKSLCKKAVNVSTPLAAHAKWVEANPDGQEVEKWEEILIACEDILDDYSEATYASDSGDIDAVGRIEALAELVIGLSLRQEPQGGSPSN